MKTRRLLLLLLITLPLSAAPLAEKPEEAKPSSGAEPPLKRKMQAAIVNHQRGYAKEAVKQLEELSARGEPEAMNLLGFWYQTGRGVVANPELALDYYRKAAIKEYAPAMVSLGRVLVGKTGATEAEKKEGVEWLIKAAQAKDGSAAVSLVNAYAQGMGVQKNLTEAHRWANEAAASSNSEEGAWLLYRLHSGHFGPSPENNPTDALRALKLAAADGMEEASLILGEMLATGQGMPQDREAALNVLTKTAEQGSAKAAFGVARLYQTQYEPDLKQADRYFTLAAELGHPVAQNLMGENLESSAKEDAKRLAQAALWYEKAAAQGNDAAMVHMADLYRRGAGITKDFNRSRELATAALKKGFLPAAAVLARLFRDAPDGTADEAKAAVLARWAVKQGYTPASGIEKEATANATPTALTDADSWLPGYLKELGLQP
jgi:uncharacterized protein